MERIRNEYIVCVCVQNATVSGSNSFDRFPCQEEEDPEDREDCILLPTSSVNT